MSLPEAIQHVEEFLRDNLETESCNTQHEELLGFLKELQARRSTPLYTPVKPEDVTEGYYWLVTQDGEKTIERIWDGYGDGALGMESPEGWVTVSEIYELGGVLYSIPPLEVAE